MTELLHEQLSALIDGELPAEETSLLLKRLERDPELRQRLARYQASGDCLRGERGRLRDGLAGRVSAALAAEPDHLPPAAAARRRPLRAVGGLAIAASVALAAIIVFGRAGGPASGTLPAAAPPAPAALAANLPVKPSLQALPLVSTEPASYVTPAARQGLGVIPDRELTNYVVAHSEVSGPLGTRSVLTSLVTDDSPGNGASVP